MAGAERHGGTGDEPLRAVLLDAHGTLVSLEAPAPALRRLLAQRHGVQLTEEQAERAIAAEIAYYRAHLDEGRDAASVALLRGRCAGALREALAAERLLDRLAPDDLTAALLASLVFRPFPEVPGVLRDLRAAGLKLIAVSNWDASLAGTLASLGLASLLDGIVTSAQAGAAKPSAEIFGAALRLAGVGPGQAVHVGDSLVEDVQGARAAGLRAVLVARSGGPVPAGVTAVGSLAELPGLLTSTP